MTDEQKSDQPEIEKIKLKSFKAWWRIIMDAFAVVFRSPEAVQPPYQTPLDPLPEEPKIILGRKKAGIDKEQRPLKYTVNEYELQSDDKVVYDKTTGLMWQQSGSDFSMLPAHMGEYITKLNSENFAGYYNWRLPTLHEAKSLIEPMKNETNNLYIDPIFNKKQHETLTSDFYNSTEPWTVDFGGGICCDVCGHWFNYVRAVR